MRRYLYSAAEYDTPEVLAELVAETDEVDQMMSGRTALWRAVFSNRPDNVRILLDAGADPSLPMMSGWSPGRLSLAGPHPLPGDHGSLTSTEVEAVAESRLLLAALDGQDYEGVSVACVADLSAAEAARRLGGVETGEPTHDEMWSGGDDVLYVVGVSDVPGGCVVTQPWAYAANMPGLMNRLSPGTDCCGLYENPKSGSQASLSSDGAYVRELYLGGGPDEHDRPEEILTAYLYQHNAVAHACAFVGVRPPDTRAVLGPPDRWLRMPRLDYWAG